LQDFPFHTNKPTDTFWELGQTEVLNSLPFSSLGDFEPAAATEL
jgi:hypothetical protein